MKQLKNILDNNSIAENLLIAIAAILLLWTLLKIIKTPILKSIKKDNSRYFTNKIFDYIGYILSITIVVYIFTKKMDGLDLLLAAIGGGGAIALKDVLMSIVGWFMIKINNTYKLGDRVELGGIHGDVVDINLLRTTIMEIGEWIHGLHYTGRVVTVTNDTLFKPVYNYSKGSKFIWDEIDIDITNDSDVELAQSIVKEIAEKYTEQATEDAKADWENMTYLYYTGEVNMKPHIGIRIEHNYLTLRIRYSVDYLKKEVSKSGIHQDTITAFKNTNGKVKLLPYMVMKIENQA